MAEPKNKKLYSKVKKEADKKFEAKTGVYKSSWIVREYKKRGGQFKGSKPNSNTGTLRWYKEKWIDLNRPIRNSKGKVIGYKSCGRKSSRNSREKYPLCRPSRRVTSATPVRYQELSKKSIAKAKKQKSRVKGRKNIKFGGDTGCDAGCMTGGGAKQYRGRKSAVMVSVPQNVRKWAEYALRLKTLGFRGATETGHKRAKQLARKSEIPIEDLRYMRNWFARHIVTSYPGFKVWKDAGRPKTKEWHNKRAIWSWLSWAGDAGLKWVNSERTIKLLNRHFNKNYKKIK